MKATAEAYELLELAAYARLHLKLSDSYEKGLAEYVKGKTADEDFLKGIAATPEYKVATGLAGARRFSRGRWSQHSDIGDATVYRGLHQHGDRFGVGGSSRVAESATGAAIR